MGLKKNNIRWYLLWSAIVTEELQAFFEGEKAAEEATKIIQSRVQLYMDENY